MPTKLWSGGVEEPSLRFLWPLGSLNVGNADCLRSLGGDLSGNLGRGFGFGGNPRDPGRLGGGPGGALRRGLLPALSPFLFDRRPGGGLELLGPRLCFLWESPRRSLVSLFS